jgi:hypothetical protein
MLDRGGVEAANDPGMECLGRDVGAIGPHDRSELPVERDLAEVLGIGKRLENAAPTPRGQIDLARCAILECQA